MKNDTKSVNVYTIDGRVFTMDEYAPNLNRGIKIERYGDGKVIRRQFLFNGDWIVCSENIFIGKEEKEIDPKDRWDPEKFGRPEDKDKKKFLHDQVDQQEEKEKEINKEFRTPICCGEFSDMVNKGLILYRFDPFHVNPFDILSRNGETIQSGCTHCMFCGSKK